jgi:outer membrane biosynthesis protein TonB
MDWSDISAEPLPDSLFEVPVGYRQASLSEFAQAINQQATPTPDANLPLITDSTLGNRDKSIPSVISSADPEYTPEARRAKIQGAVVLQATIGVDGVARKWKFRPAEKDGAPSAMDVKIEIRFRILER